MQTGKQDRVPAPSRSWLQNDGTLKLDCPRGAGNTIFVALGTSGQNNKPFGWAYSLCSIGCFAAGSVAFARAHQLAGGGRLRRTVALSFLVQTLFVAVAAAVVQTGVVDGTYPSTTRGGSGGGDARPDFTDLAVVALLSFQAAGQIVNSRGLGVGEVPTVVITSLLCDLLGDPALLARANGKRDRRAAAFILTLVGAIAGGWLSKAIGAVQPSLWLAAAIKAVITVFWLGLLRLARQK